MPAMPYRAAAAAILWTAFAAHAQQSGSLQPFGEHLAPADAATTTLLDDGSIVIFGFGPAIDERLTAAKETAMLRARREARHVPVIDPDPKLWDAKARGWRRLSNAPECNAQLRYLHTATLLRDGRVLFAGGLCDEPKMADDASPFPAFTALSLLDPRVRKWLPAPSLLNARVRHTATLLADGSVLFVGGETDPMLSQAPVPVIDSVERFSNGKIDAMPPLHHARARHTATAMADGSLLVAGGFDGSGRAIASVELYEPAQNAWRELPPLRGARHGHTATRLADGRVLVVGGKGADEQPLGSTEIWDPAREAWLSGPALPSPLQGHAAVLLANAEVLVAGLTEANPIDHAPWAWTWGPSTADWQVAGHLTRSKDYELANVTLAARADGGAIAFTANTIMRWMPASSAAADAPVWESKPSIAALKGRRVLVVGHEAQQHDALTARVWDAATQRWSSAGRVRRPAHGEGSTRELRSGRVIHVGVNAQNAWECQQWEPPETWSDCGSLPLERRPAEYPVLGELPDGRALAIVSSQEVAVLDEATGTWARWRIRWNPRDWAYGAPIRQQAPFAEVAEPGKDEWIPIDEAAGRFHGAHPDAGLIAMLWDPRASRWGYVFPNRDMGTDAKWLPDGCAISTSPLALFDPASGKARALADPGLGVPAHSGAMAVLEDGTVVVAGVAIGARDPGAGFFHSKASCAGFAGSSDYISGGLAVDSPIVPTLAAAPTAPASERGLPNRIAAAKAWVIEHRLVLLAAGIPLAIVLLLRRTRIGKARAPVSRGLRIVIYVILALLITPYAVTYGLFYLGTSATDCADSRMACEAHPPWWVAVANKLRPAKEVPCRVVGLWASRQGPRMYRIDLKDDGTYSMEADALGTSRERSGRWNVDGTRMVWWHDQLSGGRDVNEMEFLTDGRFNLTEINGSITRFELIKPPQQGRCKR